MIYYVKFDFWNAFIKYLSRLRISSLWKRPERINNEINFWRHQDKLELFVIGKYAKLFPPSVFILQLIASSSRYFLAFFSPPSCDGVFFLRQINKGYNDDIAVINASKIKLVEKTAERNEIWQRATLRP